MPATTATSRSVPAPVAVLRVLLHRFGITLALFVLVAGLAILSPKYFLTVDNLSNVARQTSVNAVLALGQFLVILTAGIDLSVGAVMALSMILMAMSSHTLFGLYSAYYVQAGVAWLPDPQGTLAMVVISGVAIALGVGAGLFTGLLNGWGMTRLRLPHPFIVTLGMLNMARGATDLISGGAPITGIPRPMRMFGAGSILVFPTSDDSWFSIPMALVVVVLLYVMVAAVVNHTRFGRHMRAMGGSVQAARNAGINVDRVLNVVYMLCGGLAAVAALLLAGRTNSGYPKAGVGAELDSIAAVIIGGASFFGGRGAVAGTFVGVLIIGFMRNGLNLLNVSVFWQEVAIGAIIVAAAFVDVLRRRAARLQT